MRRGSKFLFEVYQREDAAALPTPPKAMVDIHEIIFDPELVQDTVGCPGCGRRLRCSCTECAERKWPERTNGPGIGFLVDVDGQLQKCNDCGYTAHADEWLKASEDEYEYGELLAPVISE